MNKVVRRWLSIGFFLLILISSSGVFGFPKVISVYDSLGLEGLRELDGLECRINEPDLNGSTIIFYAALLNTPDLLSFVLTIPFIEVNHKDSQGGTALMVAALEGKLENVKLLVSNGADYRAVDNSGLTVVHYAAASGNYEMVKYFICGLGLKLDSILSNDGTTPLRIAEETGFVDVKNLILDAQKGIAVCKE